MRPAPGTLGYADEKTTAMLLEIKPVGVAMPLIKFELATYWLRQQTRRFTWRERIRFCLRVLRAIWK